MEDPDADENGNGENEDVVPLLAEDIDSDDEDDGNDTTDNSWIPSTIHAFQPRGPASPRCVRNADGPWDPNRVIDRPSTVAIYNKGMGGTDSFDQRIAYYRPKTKNIYCCFMCQY